MVCLQSWRFAGFMLIVVPACYAFSECNDVGTKSANGTCICLPDFYGEDCECNSLYGLPLEACINIGETKRIPCSGRGYCRCGLCECMMRQNGGGYYTGQFCECDDFSCPHHNGRICGGPANGKCKCGSCVCNEGYDGPACEGSDSVESCISKDTGKVCNDAGMCIHGACRCEGMHAGRFCEDCPTCPGLCERKRACARCSFDRDDVEEGQSCEVICGNTYVTVVSVLDKEKDMYCHFREIQFTITQSENGEVLIKIPSVVQIELPIEEEEIRTTQQPTSSVSKITACFLASFLLILLMTLL